MQRRTGSRSPWFLGGLLLFLGSVADKVIRGASVPVLVHRPAHK